ncbi:hypothetical protein DFH08DRAFT_797146 [Mycena albidolilacea]|uniref:Uncharacterized protein n=1 Tax=Mycena albidolilacea TaxID=1033008 RepID=A0AAD7AQW5_9AGAR|nr:hypothetical protein DFH08DRAFT_797146 [Mycena albidolilacea]
MVPLPVEVNLSLRSDLEAQGCSLKSHFLANFNTPKDSTAAAPLVPTLMFVKTRFHMLRAAPIKILYIQLYEIDVVAVHVECNLNLCAEPGVDGRKRVLRDGSRTVSPSASALDECRGRKLSELNEVAGLDTGIPLNCDVSAGRPKNGTDLARSIRCVPNRSQTKIGCLRPMSSADVTFEVRGKSVEMIGLESLKSAESAREVYGGYALGFVSDTH